MTTAMNRFIRCANVKHYRELLKRTKSEGDRQRVLRLLSEEERKQRDAGDERDGTQQDAGPRDDVKKDQHCANNGNRDRDQTGILVQGEPWLRS